MIRIPEQNRPFTPPVNVTQAGAPPKTEAEQKPGARVQMPQIGKGPEMDTQAIQTRIAVLATEAKQRELKFEEIIELVIKMTGLTNPEAAMEEANRKQQKEIDDTLEAIKSNKDLMEEAESWQALAEMLERELNNDQRSAFLDLLKDTIRVMAKT